jgi:hypothetical protein
VCEARPDPKPLSSKATSATARGAELHRLIGFRH